MPRNASHAGLTSEAGWSAASDRVSRALIGASRERYRAAAAREWMECGGSAVLPARVAVVQIAFASDVRAARESVPPELLAPQPAKQTLSASVAAIPLPQFIVVIGPCALAANTTAYAAISVSLDATHRELASPRAGSRVFSLDVRPGLADCAPSGRARLDALARWLQDVAYADVEDAGLAASAVWVVRRTRIVVSRFPRFAERLTAHTFCSGIGRAWAERRTTIERAGEAEVEAVSLWVHLDPANWHPAPFNDAEIAVYGDAAGDRRVTARLRHPAPPEDPAETEWTFRASECDVADHVNNAAYLTPLEEELLSTGAAEPPRFDVEVEYRAPAQPGRHRILASGKRRWIVAGGGDEVHASLDFRP